MKRITVLMMVFMLLFVSSVYGEELKVKNIELIPNTTVSVGGKINLNIVVVYDDEFSIHSDNDPYYRRNTGLSKTDYTISEPHILQVLSTGMVKVTGVGSSTITVKVENVERSVTISGSLDEAIDGGYIKNGVTLVPMKEVFKALGGSVNYIAQQGTFEIKVGSTRLTLPKTGTKATLNGEPLTLKSPLLVQNGVTLFPASVLSDALDGVLTYNSKAKQMQISIGKGKMTINIEQPQKQNSVTATTPTKGKLYAVPATGEMTGWSILKGHPYVKSIRVYFKVNGSIVQIYTKDIRKVDLNKKVTWTDLEGKKHTNTVKQLYTVFGELSNEYTSDILYKMFGKTYSDWIGSTSLNADRYVDQYLEQQGLIEPYGSNITLTPDTEVY
ncbi:copper amine oxidase N-terminal domain-containing protein [Paenibacillus xylanexedens]|uniref:copper amine oxidase N-terminal domain-containing protein n=1 Tax=Paenibacillus xylanexedens TaxID=528191 RepID=UPI0011A25B65|nr:copper amine oxidase N-terminal domain-containing protein [Paenibacillus xylanexedens]